MFVKSQFTQAFEFILLGPTKADSCVSQVLG